MSKEAMKLALEALESERMYFWNSPEKIEAAITALREALAEQPAQQEQLREENERLHVENRRLIDRIETIGVSVGVGGIATTTAQRTWVNATTWRGLTDKEIDQGLLRSDYAFKTAEAWRAGVVFAMTKLKAKNSL